MNVDLLDHMGTDLDVANAARVSFDKFSEWIYDEEGRQCLAERDRKLIHYLAEHDHFTPFTHVVVKVRITAPIFVARQLFKHTVGVSANERSGRYVDSTPEFFMPDTWRAKAPNVKQGSSDQIVEAVELHGELSSPERLAEDLYKMAEVTYNAMIKAGVCAEQARMVLPQSMYTQWLWTASVSAYSRICNLRLAPHAQKETRLIAKKISDIMEVLFPVSWEALRKPL